MRRLWRQPYHSQEPGRVHWHGRCRQLTRDHDAQGLCARPRRTVLGASGLSQRRLPSARLPGSLWGAKSCDLFGVAHLLQHTFQTLCCLLRRALIKGEPARLHHCSALSCDDEFLDEEYRGTLDVTLFFATSRAHVPPRS